MNTFCMTCGEVIPAGTSRCTNCDREHDRRRLRKRQPPKTTSTARGYDAAWKRLSARARKLQPFCEDCGSTDDLQCDHTPEAWSRKERGLAVRLQDVAVVCGPCNRRRGAARGKTAHKARRAVEHAEPNQEVE